MNTAVFLPSFLPYKTLQEQEATAELTRQSQAQIAALPSDNCILFTFSACSLQEQEATVAQAAEATRQYQAHIAALHEQYQARHAEHTPAIAEVTDVKVQADVLSE